jgi:hypothetical protein
MNKLFLAAFKGCPPFTPKAVYLLRVYYLAIRKIRCLKLSLSLLLSLARIFAKLCFRNFATESDAIIIIMLYEDSLNL